MSTLFADVPGAVVDGTRLAHVGSPLREQRMLARGEALAVVDRSVIVVSGEDRLSWLDSLTSQALAALPAGEGTELLVLDPQGHVEHAAAVVDDGAATWLITAPDGAEALAGWLTRMRFRMRVEVRDVTADTVVLAGTAAAVEGVEALARWRDPWPAVGVGGHAYATVEGHPGAERDWVEVVVASDVAARVAAEAVAGTRALAGDVAAEALRVAAWRPSRAEVDGRTLPHEADWLRTAVHLAKGCYRGQETVAKVHNLGHPPRRLVALLLDGTDDGLPEPGAAVMRDGAEVGVVTSAALHHEDGPIALALVKRTTPVDATLTVALGGGVAAAAQEVIVPTDAGRTAAPPPLSRLSRRR